MAIQTATTLYPVNSTTIESDTGIDVRLLDSAEAGATATQTATATHTQDGQNRTFDPAGPAATTNSSPGNNQNKGWALRLTEDMTPSDDTNCNAFLSSGSISVTLSVTINQSGGTYASGTYSPLWALSLFRRDPSADTTVHIGTGTASSPTWTIGGIGVDLGTVKTVTLTAIVIAAPGIEFQPGEVLYAQIGLNTSTIPNPTLGTATWTYTLNVDHTNTKITFAAGQALSSLCFITGSSSGIASASGALAPVFPTAGSSSGSATASGVLEADKETTGSSVGVATASGTLEAEKETTGLSSGVATASGVPAVVVPTTGTVNVSEGGETTTVVIAPIFD